MTSRYERLLQHPPSSSKSIAELMKLASNEKYPSTANLFAHLIGLAQDEWDSPKFEGEIARDYTSLFVLGNALTQYAVAPEAVLDYFRALLDAEVEEDEEVPVEP